MSTATLPPPPVWTPEANLATAPRAFDVMRHEHGTGTRTRIGGTNDLAEAIAAALWLTNRSIDRRERVTFDVRNHADKRMQYTDLVPAAMDKCRRLLAQPCAD
jgi:hypothetical protein